MGRGRKPKPTALKLMDGDFQVHPERRNHNEPQVPEGIPACPDHLTQLAKNEWKRICKEMKTLGVLTKIERSAIEQYCTAYGEWRECLKDLEKNGRFITSPSGVYVENPAGRALRGHGTTCLKALIEFGMTPVSRSRLHVQKTTEENSVEKRFFG